jgi:[CysO sulfur-carrier protein]-S-L-cysteine hydrolase
VTMHLPLVNALASPTEYESEPQSLFAAHKAMRVAGVDVLAVYHSHPTSDPIPSRRDRERSYDERVVHLIIGLGGAEPEVRGWRLRADVAIETAWQIEPG